MFSNPKIMAHLIRKYNPGNSTDTLSIGTPPLSVDPISAAWYNTNLPLFKTAETPRNGYVANRILTGTDVISAKLLDSLRALDSNLVRRPPKGTLSDEYSKYTVTASPPISAEKSSYIPKSVSFAKPPNSDLYGGNSATSKLPQVKSETVSTSYPFRSNDLVSPPYKISDIPSYPTTASAQNRLYATSYASAYNNYSKTSRDDDRMRRNSLANRSRENSMFQTKEPSIGTDEYYMRKMGEILNQPCGGLFPSSPSPITDFMYVGGYRDAENWMYLKRHGITHVLNTAAMRRSTFNPYPPESGIVGYESFDADDIETYDMMQHFARAKAFIDRCKWSGGKVLVHCAMGVNRSGTMCCAYLMADQKLSLLDAVRRMKQRRWTTLCNRGFQKQLLRYARQKGHL